MQSLLAVAEGDYTFDWEALSEDALAHWEGSVVVRAEAPRTATSYGQLKLPSADDRTALLVDLLSGGIGMGVAGDEDSASHFVAWLAARPGFPDGSIVLTDWSFDLYPVYPGMLAEEIRAAYTR